MGQGPSDQVEKTNDELARLRKKLRDIKDNADFHRETLFEECEETWNKVKSVGEELKVGQAEVTRMQNLTSQGFFQAKRLLNELHDEPDGFQLQIVLDELKCMGKKFEAGQADVIRTQNLTNQSLFRAGRLLNKLHQASAGFHAETHAVFQEELTKKDKELAILRKKLDSDTSAVHGDQPQHDAAKDALWADTGGSDDHPATPMAVQAPLGRFFSAGQ